MTSTSLSLKQFLRVGHLTALVSIWHYRIKRACRIEKWSRWLSEEYGLKKQEGEGRDH